MSSGIYPLGKSDGMSEGEYQSMYEACDEGDPPPPALQQPYGYWRTRHGEQLKIVEMDTSHIKNAIKLFTRAGWGDHTKLRELREELARRGP